MRTFLLMIGSAVCGIVIFVAAVYGYFYYQFSRVGGEGTVHFPPRNEKMVTVAPPVIETERFYGSHASWAGEFSATARQTVLAAGPGKLLGKVSSDGRPLQGLRLRLALNGAVMSQWTTSGADGTYEIPVPYGTYRVDGYELDASVANKLLSGKIDGARHHLHTQEATVVAQDKPGKGLDFDYVDPVRKKGPFGDVSLAQPVIFSWEPYPNAASYRVQLVEQKDPRDYETQRYVFEWKQRPIVVGTSVNLSEQGVSLRKGYSYTVHIEALDERKHRLSEAPRNVHKADFRVAD